MKKLIPRWTSTQVLGHIYVKSESRMIANILFKWRKRWRERERTMKWDVDRVEEKKIRLFPKKQMHWYTCIGEEP